MAAMRPAPILIGGREWRDVTNETCGGMVYDYEDVVRAGGQIPTTITIRGGNPEPKANMNRNRPNRADRRGKTKCGKSTFWEKFGNTRSGVRP